MKEKDFQILFKNKNKLDGAFELKIVKKKSIPFSAVAEHQVNSLLAVESGEFFYKIPDPHKSATMYSSKRPFDCIKLPALDGFVVLGWYAPRKFWDVCYIKITNFINYSKVSTKKSITLDEAKSISWNYQLWKTGVN